MRRLLPSAFTVAFTVASLLLAGSAAAHPSPEPFADFVNELEIDLSDHYPDAYRTAGIEGAVQVTITVSPDGEATACQIAQGSGHDELDRLTCDTLLAIDISAAAIAKARSRLGKKPGLTLARMAFPREAPPATGFDLVLLSEVVYYWSDEDLERTAQWLDAHVAFGGHILLVHYTGETDYPQSGDGAVGFLKDALGEAVIEEQRSERHNCYRLDLWRRR